MNCGSDDTEMQLIELYWNKFVDATEEIVHLAFEFSNRLHETFKPFLRCFLDDTGL
jgi:hypothetical protein